MGGKIIDNIPQWGIQEIKVFLGCFTDCSDKALKNILRPNICQLLLVAVQRYLWMESNSIIDQERTDKICTQLAETVDYKTGKL